MHIYQKHKNAIKGKALAIERFSVNPSANYIQIAKAIIDKENYVVPGGIESRDNARDIVAYFGYMNSQR